MTEIAIHIQQFGWTVSERHHFEAQAFPCRNRKAKTAQYSSFESISQKPHVYAHDFKC